jgi:predicted GH43/DUF377 family glycosyl hydrolase
MKYFIFIFFGMFFSELQALIDLDAMEQPFVLETKQIKISGYPDAFNPSIVQWNDKILMSFRSRDSSNNATLVGFTWLDDRFNPIGKPQLLLQNKEESCCSYIQDPRLFIISDKLYMAYSDLIKDPGTHIKKRKMCVAEVNYDGVRFSLSNIDCYHQFEGIQNNKFEKNWVPFNYQDILLLAYTLSPHKIFLPLHGEEKCVTIAESLKYNSWKWGVLRGGTPALLVDNKYLAFFHSSISLETIQSEAQSMTHYFMGAYVFENHPPFSLLKMSSTPIVSKDFYNGQTHETWKPLRVVFPCGFIFDDKYIWVSYGRQDYEAWIVKLDKAGLLKSLSPVESDF